MSSNYTEFDVQLWDVRLGQAIDDDTGLYCVLQAGIPLKQTSYSDSSGATTLTQPATMTDGRINFFVASTTTTVDLSIMTAAGKSYFIEGLTASQHRVDVDPYQENYTLVGSWAVLSAHADGVVSAVFAPQSGGLPRGLRIKDVYAHITSAVVGVASGMVMDFGVSGDPNGFIDGIEAEVTGYYMNNPVVDTMTATVTGGFQYVMPAQVRGQLLAVFGTGLDTITTAGVRGWFAKKNYMISLVTTTNNLVFAITGTSALTTAVGSKGYVFFEYDILPTAGN